MRGGLRAREVGLQRGSVRRLVGTDPIELGGVAGIGELGALTSGSTPACGEPGEQRADAGAECEAHEEGEDGIHGDSVPVPSDTEFQRARAPLIE